MPAAMYCKTRKPTAIWENKAKYACIVEADESMRFRMEGAPHRYREDHIAGKGMNSLSRYNLVHKFIPMPQAMKIPDADGSSGEIMGKNLKIPAWQLTKVRNKNEVIAEARKEGKTVHFASLMDLCHLENSESEPQFQKYKDIVKDIEDRMLYSLSRDHQHHK